MKLMRKAWSKRTVCLSGVAALSVALLAGCASEAPGGNGDEPLEVWTRSSPEAAATYEDMFAAFTEQTGIEVDYQGVVEFDTQLQARAAQKDVPDVLINDSGSLGAYVAQGLISPVDRSAVEGGDQVADETWAQSVGTDGQQYGIPFSRQANILVIRKDWREAVGMPQPTTWAEVDALAEAFATQDPDGDGDAENTFGMVVPGTAESGYIARWGAPYVWQAGGEIMEQEGEGYVSVIDSPETIEGLEFIKQQFCTDGHVVPGSINLTTAEAKGFQDGTAGMYLTGPYNLAGFDAAVGKENVEVVPMPAGPDSATTFAEGEDIYFGSTSDRDDDRYRLAEFLISEQTQRMGMDSPTDDMSAEPYYSVVRLPVNTTVDVGSVYDDPRWQITADAYAESGHPYPWNIDFIPFRQIVADGMNEMMAECGSDIPSILSEIDRDLQDQIVAAGLEP